MSALILDSEPPLKKLLDRVRNAIWVKHYSYRTEKSHINWIKRYIGSKNYIFVNDL